MDLLNVMQWVCLVVTLLLHLSGLPPCLEMYKTNNTEKAPFLFFLLNILSCFGMLHYGLLVGNSILIFLNTVGAFLQFMYICTFLLCATSKGKYIGLLCLGILYEIGLYWYVFNVVDPSEIAGTMGKFSSSIVTILTTMPALELINNFKNKNADGMPPVMVLGGFLCGVSWLIYGMMLDDPNVYRPNIPGVSIAALKLVAITLYGENQKTDGQTLKKMN